MPFFYSQYLKDDKGKGGRPSGSGGSKVTTATALNLRSGVSLGSAGTRKQQPSPSRRNSGSRLVWHSNIGASALRKSPKANFKYKADGKKVVHFSTIEVQPFHFDWDLAPDVFYTRRELTAMGQSRFDDAATLRQQRLLDGNSKGASMDDGDISTKSKNKDVGSLLTTALEDSDIDDNVSIRGIEHFVYPNLQQEMIRRKKEVQREVLEFVRSKRPDPQGWRLAQHSRTYSQWARNVALEKGMKYYMNNVATDPEINISEDEMARLQKSTDELEASTRSLRGSNSFSANGSTSASFDLENCMAPSPSVGGLSGICEKGDGEGDEETLLEGEKSQQSAGIVDTGED